LLYFVYTELAVAYVLFAYATALGILQIVGTHEGLEGLTVAEARRARGSGYGLGAVLIVGATAAFFLSQWQRILTPGPAGSELALLYALGAALGVITSLAVATARLRRRRVHGEEQGETVDLGRFAALLYTPGRTDKVLPAVALLPGPGAYERHALHLLASELAQAQVVTLLLDLSAEKYVYPDVLALVPAASTWLSKRSDVDQSRMAIIGYDLGGNLAIRAASSDRQVKAVAALAPVFQEPPVGLDLMSELAYPEAWAYSRDTLRAELRSELNAADYLTRVHPRPLLLLVGARDRLAPWTHPVRSSVRDSERSDEATDSLTVRRVDDAGHLDLIDSAQTRDWVVRWIIGKL